MPKMKTHRGAAKRLKYTGTGKIRRRKAYVGHLFLSKSSKRKRKLRQSTIVDPSNEKRIRRLLPR
ncbi:50S ribosomal protein L35 [Candidatus Poribacteria bacterium]|nr:50S ribosomal protein L35 [Candidatus Poribacteria bacterium]